MKPIEQEFASNKSAAVENVTKSGLQGMKDSLEVTGKAFIFLAGICYVIGLIVVNIHLRQFGFYSLSLLQLNYVTAGTWAFLPMMLPVFGGIAIMDAIYKKMREKNISFSLEGKTWRDHWVELLENIIAIVGAAVGATTTVGVIVIALANALGLKTGWIWIRVGVAGALIGYAIGVAIYRIKTRWPNSRKEYVRHVMRIFLVVIFFLIYVSYFARELYKEIPAALGGGSPHNIRLIVEDGNKLFLEAAGLSFESNSLKSDPIELILAADKEYVLRSKSTGQAISVPNDIIKAVLFEKE